MSDPVEMYRIVLRAYPISLEDGEEAAKYIEDDVRKNRPWLENPDCIYETSTLSLIFKAENGYDSTGLALRADFANFIIGSVINLGDFDIDVESVTKFYKR